MEVAADRTGGAASETRRGWSRRVSLLWIGTHAVLIALLHVLLIGVIYLCGPYGAAMIGLAFGGTQFALLRRGDGHDSRLPIWWLITTVIAAIALFYLAFYRQDAFDARFFPAPAWPSVGGSRAAYAAVAAAYDDRTILLALVHGLIYGFLFGGMQVIAALLSAPLRRRQLIWLWWIPATALAGMLVGALSINWLQTLTSAAPSTYAFLRSGVYTALYLLLPGAFYGSLTGLILASIFRASASREIAHSPAPNP